MIVLLALSLWSAIGLGVFFYHRRKADELEFSLRDILLVLEFLNDAKDSIHITDYHLKQYTHGFHKCVMKWIRTQKDFRDPFYIFRTYILLWPNQIFSYNSPAFGITAVQKWSGSLISRHSDQIVNHIKYVEKDPTKIAEVVENIEQFKKLYKEVYK